MPDHVEPTPGVFLTQQEEHVHSHVRSFYQTLLQFGVAREQARKVWPMGGYTVGFCKMDLRNWLLFRALRLPEDVQHETRSYAQVIASEIIEPLYPVTYEAFEDYVLNSMTLSAQEIAVVRGLLAAGKKSRLTEDVLVTFLPNKTERAACRMKLIHLGLMEGSA